MRNQEGYLKILARDRQFLVLTKQLILGRETKDTNEDPSVRFFSLGTAKNISRKHCVLEWVPESRQWILVVHGKNGVEVDGTFLKPVSDPYGEALPPPQFPIHHRSRLRIEDEDFFVLFPKNAS